MLSEQSGSFLTALLFQVLSKNWKSSETQFCSFQLGQRGHISWGPACTLKPHQAHGHLLQTMQASPLGSSFSRPKPQGLV